MRYRVMAGIEKFYAFYAFYAWWDYFPQSGALEGPLALEYQGQ